eukprot:tig00020592_g11664.t1
MLQAGAKNSRTRPKGKVVRPSRSDHFRGLRLRALGVQPENSERQLLPDSAQIEGPPEAPPGGPAGVQQLQYGPEPPVVPAPASSSIVSEACSASFHQPFGGVAGSVAFPLYNFAHDDYVYTPPAVPAYSFAYADAPEQPASSSSPEDALAWELRRPPEQQQTAADFLVQLEKDGGEARGGAGEAGVAKYREGETLT